MHFGTLNAQKSCLKFPKIGFGNVWLELALDFVPVLLVEALHPVFEGVFRFQDQGNST